MCTCFEWQSTGIPYSHAIAAILIRKEDPQTYAQAFLSLDAYRRTYVNAILLPDADKADAVPEFPHSSDNKGHSSDNEGQTELVGTLNPPHTRRLPERPLNRRIRSGVEGPFGTKRAKRCGRCKGLEHSVRTCNEPI